MVLCPLISLPLLPDMPLPHGLRTSSTTPKVSCSLRDYGSNSNRSKQDQSYLRKSYYLHTDKKVIVVLFPEHFPLRMALYILSFGCLLYMKLLPTIHTQCRLSLLFKLSPPHPKGTPFLRCLWGIQEQTSSRLHTDLITCLPFYSCHHPIFHLLLVPFVKSYIIISGEYGLVLLHALCKPPCTEKAFKITTAAATTTNCSQYFS